MSPMKAKVSGIVVNARTFSVAFLLCIAFKRRLQTPCLTSHIPSECMRIKIRALHIQTVSGFDYHDHGKDCREKSTVCDTVPLLRSKQNGTECYVHARDRVKERGIHKPRRTNTLT